jgi:hypothetical protein
VDPPFSPVFTERRVVFETEEWIPPQSPLSEDTTTKSLRVGASSGLAFWKTSTNSVRQVIRQRVTKEAIPEFAIPYCFPLCMARCAFASLVEAIIFMD